MKKDKLYRILLLLAMAGQSCDTAFETNLAGRKVTLRAPVNNLVTTDTFQTFYWDKINGADKYRLQVVSPKFDSIVRLIQDTTITSDRFTIDMNTGTYQWRVSAINSGSVSGPGDVWNIRIQ